MSARPRPAARAPRCSTRSPAGGGACGEARPCRSAGNARSPRTKTRVDRVAGRARHRRRRSPAAGPGSRSASDDLPTFGRPRIATADLVVSASLLPCSPSPSSCVEPLDDRVQQVAGAAAVQRRDRDRVAQAERVQLERRRPRGRRRRPCSRPPAPAAASGAGSGRSPRRRRPARRGRRSRAAPGRPPRPPAGPARRPAPAWASRRRRRRRRCRSGRTRGPRHSHGHLVAVAGHARALVDDRLPRRREPVDQRRLARVREADDRHRPVGAIGRCALAALIPTARTGSGSRP